MREYTLSLYKTYRLILHRYDKNLLFIEEAFREDATDKEIYDFLVNVIYEVVPNVKKTKFDITPKVISEELKVETPLNIEDILQVKYVVPNERDFVRNLIVNSVRNGLVDFQLPPGGEQRSVGDIIEDMVCKIILNIVNDNVTELVPARGVKSIEDVTLKTLSMKYYIDSKTHKKDSIFSMPNLSAIKKLKNEILRDKNELIYIFVDYIKDNNNMVTIYDVNAYYCYELDWSILDIQALGLGQLQIKDKNKELKFTDIGRDLWFETLHKNVLESYLKKQEEKIEKQKKFWNQ